MRAGIIEAQVTAQVFHGGSFALTSAKLKYSPNVGILVGMHSTIFDLFPSRADNQLRGVGLMCTPWTDAYATAHPHKKGGMCRALASAARYTARQAGRTGQLKPQGRVGRTGAYVFHATARCLGQHICAGDKQRSRRAPSGSAASGNPCGTEGIHQGTSVHQHKQRDYSWA